jgi:hypothetical protein
MILILSYNVSLALSVTTWLSLTFIFTKNATVNVNINKHSTILGNFDRCHYQSEYNHNSVYISRLQFSFKIWIWSQNVKISFVSPPKDALNLNSKFHPQWMNDCLLIVIHTVIEVKKIIDYLHNDNDTLKTCFLGCRAWLLPSWYHIFAKCLSKSHWITPTKVNDYLGILNSETDNYISLFIHQVDFYNVHSDYSLYPFFPLLNMKL